MVEQITPEGFAAWTQAAGAQGTAPLLLDVREPAEWRAASVAPQGCELLQMPMHTVPARLAELDRDRPVAVLCHHGGRSMQVAQFLVNQGFAQVANIAGGIDAWAVELDGSIPRY